MPNGGTKEKAMNDPHIDIDLLERYVTRSHLVTVAQAADIARHLADCSSCAAHALDIGVFYEGLAQVEVANEARAQRITEKALSSPAAGARIIELYPRHRPTMFNAAKPSIIALAAQDTNTRPHYAPAATLLSHDESTIVRVTRNNKEQTYQLQVIADAPEHAAHVLVSFDCIEGEFPTDETGEAVIAHAKPVNFSQAHALIRLPLDVFGRTQAALFGTGGSAEGTHGHLLQVERGSAPAQALLRIVRKGDAFGPADATTIALFDSDGLTHVYGIESGCAELPAAELERAEYVAVY